MRGIVAAAVALALSGCAASTVEELRANPAQRYDFSVDDTYESAYRNIVRAARSCWSGGFPAQLIVDADLYEDIGQGKVTLRMSGMSSRVPAHVAILKRASGGADITVWNSLSTWNDMGPRVQRWAGGDQNCS